MIKLSQILFSLIIALCFVSLANPQKVDALELWLKIKPLKSSKADVDKMFLKGREGINNKYMVSYDAYYGVAIVKYASGDCKNGIERWWNVPEWTVIDVLYSTSEESPELKPLLKSMGKYKTRRAGDAIDVVDVYNEEKGVSLFYSLTTNSVIEILVEPTLKQKKEYGCDNR